jgi:endoglucanase
MEQSHREFLETLLETPSPSGHEESGQRVWSAYVEDVADEVRTDAYGNAVAVHEGTGGTDGPAVALAGHADEIGFRVRTITDEGFLRLVRVGGADPTVAQGQHVVVHGDTPVAGVIGQTAVHLRDRDEATVPDVTELVVDLGAADGDTARALVDVGDPVTVRGAVVDLDGTRLTGRGMDDRVGTWAVAEAFRRAVAADVEATVYAVSTIQEEVGLRGAEMVGFDLDPDAAIAVDVTHATDYPGPTAAQETGVELGAGPVVHRDATNHPRLVERIREAGEAADVPVQLAVAGNGTGTDADAFLTARGAIPSLYLGVPNRYMHTPVEVVDTDDLTATADLLAAFLERLSPDQTFDLSG